LDADAGDVAIGAVTATAGSVSVVADTGSINEVGSGDSGVDISGTVLTLTAQDGIGGAGELDIETAAGTIKADTTDGAVDLSNMFPSAVTVNSLTTGAGDIRFSQSAGGDLMVVLAQTTVGAVTIGVSEADLKAETVIAGGTGRNVTLTTLTSGDVNVDSVTGSMWDALSSR